MKRLLCYLKAIPFFIKSGVWCPHVYKDEKREHTIIIATQNGFRVSKSMNHRIGETVHPNATLIKSKCIYCGKEDLSWFDREPLLIEE